MDLSRTIAKAALASPEAFSLFAELLLSVPEAAQALGADQATLEEIRALPPQAYELIFNNASAPQEPAPQEPAPAPQAAPPKPNPSAGVTFLESEGGPKTAGRNLFEADPVEVAIYGQRGPESLAAARDFASTYRRLQAGGSPPEISLAVYLKTLIGQ
jgi:hypothetical protein